MTSKLELRSTIVALATLLALTSFSGAARTASASDAHVAADAAAADNMRLQVFLQRRFRLSAASDVQIGPPKASPIPGMSVRTVKMHNDAGQEGTFVLYIDTAGKTAVLSDVEVGAATPGPLHGLWSRPSAPGQSAARFSGEISSDHRRARQGDPRHRTRLDQGPVGTCQPR